MRALAGVAATAAQPAPTTFTVSSDPLRSRKLSPSPSLAVALSRTTVDYVHHFGLARLTGGPLEPSEETRALNSRPLFVLAGVVVVGCGGGVGGGGGVAGCVFVRLTTQLPA